MKKVKFTRCFICEDWIGKDEVRLVLEDDETFHEYCPGCGRDLSDDVWEFREVGKEGEDGANKAGRNRSAAGCR